MFFASSGVLALTMKTTPFPSVRKYHWSILPARYAFTVSWTSCGMIWARWAGVMGVPMKWEIARIFVVGTGGSGFCAEAAPSEVIGFFIAVAPSSSLVFRGRLFRRRWPFSFDRASSGSPRSRLDKTLDFCVDISGHPEGHRLFAFSVPPVARHSF